MSNLVGKQAASVSGQSDGTGEDGCKLSHEIPRFDNPAGEALRVCAVNVSPLFHRVYVK